MIIYNVTVNVDADVAEDWLRWMHSVHVPEVMATGLFLDSRILRVLAEGDGGPPYAVQSPSAAMAPYERSRAEPPPPLQAETQKRYGGRFAAFRTLLQVLHTA